MYNLYCIVYLIRKLLQSSSFIVLLLLFLHQGLPTTIQQCTREPDPFVFLLHYYQTLWDRTTRYLFVIFRTISSVYKHKTTDRSSQWQIQNHSTDSRDPVLPLPVAGSVISVWSCSTTKRFRERYAASLHCNNEQANWLYNWKFPRRQIAQIW